MSNYHCTNSGCLPPQPPAASHGCADAFRQALQLLCRSPMAAAVNWNAFSFVSDHYILGAGLRTRAMEDPAGDNLLGPSAAWLCRDGCEGEAVSGLLYPPIPGAEPLEPVMHQVHLCNLRALTFDAMEAADEGADPFRILTRGLYQLLQPCRPCGQEQTVTLAAGPLVLTGAAMLGQLSNLLVLSGEADRRFYLVCTTAIDFIG